MSYTSLVVVPEGASAGDCVHHTTPCGFELDLTIPEGVLSGSVMTLVRDEETGAWSCTVDAPQAELDASDFVPVPVDEGTCESPKDGKTSSEPRVTISIVVQNGMSAGSPITHVTDDGRELEFVVPEGAGPGSIMFLTEDIATQQWSCAVKLDHVSNMIQQLKGFAPRPGHTLGFQIIRRIKFQSSLNAIPEVDAINSGMPIAYNAFGHFYGGVLPSLLGGVSTWSAEVGGDNVETKSPPKSQISEISTSDEDEDVDSLSGGESSDESDSDSEDGSRNSQFWTMGGAISGVLQDVSNRMGMLEVPQKQQLSSYVDSALSEHQLAASIAKATFVDDGDDIVETTEYDAQDLRVGGVCGAILRDQPKLQAKPASLTCDLFGDWVRRNKKTLM